ncbi:MAG: hypothetical protein ACLQQ4_08130 [Bacteroidia bacterium]
MKANKIIIRLFTALLIGISFAAFGQETTMPPSAEPSTNNSEFMKGTNIISTGIGINSFYNYWGDGYYETPNFVLTFENGTFGNVGPGTISLGGLFSYQDINENFTGTNGYHYYGNWAYWALSFRSAYHLIVPGAPKFDPYAGVMLGYYFFNQTFSTNNPDYTPPDSPIYTTTPPNYFALSMYVGARYFLSNTVGIWGEFGSGYTPFTFGASFKL